MRKLKLKPLVRPVETGSTQTKKLSGTTVQVAQALSSVVGTTALDFEILSDRKITLNHQKAEEYIDLPVFAAERPVNDTHVQELFDEMRRGNFNPLPVVLATVELNGKVYKLNGQHTCWAVSFMPKDYSVQVREVKCRVKTEDEMRMLYRTWDRLMVRTDAHAVHVMLAGSSVAENIGPSHLSCLVAGLKRWLFEEPEARRKCTPEMAAALVKEHYPDVFLHVFKLLAQHWMTTFARRAAVVGGMFATFNTAPNKSREFWNAVITGLELPTRDDPRWRLRDFLQTTLTSSVRSRGGKGRAGATAEDMYRIVLLCWNKWRLGEPMHAAPRVPKERPKLHK